jgi:hypothetical protein
VKRSMRPSDVVRHTTKVVAALPAAPPRLHPTRSRGRIASRLVGRYPLLAPRAGARVRLAPPRHDVRPPNKHSVALSNPAPSLIGGPAEAGIGRPFEHVAPGGAIQPGAASCSANHGGSASTIVPQADWTGLPSALASAIPNLFGQVCRAPSLPAPFPYLCPPSRSPPPPASLLREPLRGRPGPRSM